MSIINAVLSHAWLAIRLKHDGKGMPKRIPAALALAFMYCVIASLNASTIDFASICGLIFIAQFYVFLLRNEVIGLMLMIGMIANTMYLAIALLGLPQPLLSMVTIFEYLMVYCGIINILKSHFQLT